MKQKHAIDVKDESYYVLARPEMKKFLPNSTTTMKVLEIGCGAGNFVHNLNGYLEYWGVEPNPNMAEQAKEKCSKVLIGSFDGVDSQIPECYFDLVICNDVIEHMADVENFLERIKTKLKPEGNLMGSIPNVRFIENILRFLIQKDWRYTEWGILDKTHLRFFTEKSLKRLFQENGFGLILFQRINPVRISFRGFKSFILNLILLISGILLGSDSLYYQFGFRVSKSNSLNS
jgi:2-polyprenyl-3-methyl-5-hydroxy-6-metoxy-1,4-benzoquinol methylase